MRTDLLKTLADHLDKVPDENFDMGVWQCRHECGFAGCAIGHAQGLPGFEGLKFELTGPGLFTPVYDGLQSWKAVARLFGPIRYSSVVYLFSASSYPDDVTPAIVAARIRRFIKRKGKQQ